MSLFDDSLVNDLAEKWKVVEKKDHVKTGEYFKKYQQSFIDEVMKHVMSKPEGRSETRKDFMMKNLKYQCMNHSEEIVLPLFSYKMTNFGDNKTKTMNGKGKFKDEETYRDAAIRLGYHKLCEPLPEEKKEKMFLMKKKTRKNITRRRTERRTRRSALRLSTSSTSSRMCVTRSRRSSARTLLSSRSGVRRTTLRRALASRSSRLIR